MSGPGAEIDLGSPSEILRIWARQGVVRWAAALFALGALALFLSGGSARWHSLLIDLFGPVLFTGLAIWQLRKPPPAEQRRAEALFWQSLLLGLCSWGTALLLRGLILNLPIERAPFRGPLDLLYLLSFLGFLVAAEQRPDDRSALADEGKRPPRWTAALFVGGLFCTLIVVPALLQPEEYASQIPSFTFFAALDGYLALRLLALAPGASERRWTLIYGAFGAFFLMLLVTDSLVLWSLIGNLDFLSRDWLDLIFLLSYALLLAASGTRRVHAVGRVRVASQPSMSQAFAVPPATWALLFPAFHLLANRVGALDPRSGAVRDVVVLAFTGALFAAAFAQQRRFEARVGLLVRERRQVETRLRENENDLRLLVERNRATEKLRAAEERFARAFEASPDAMVLSQLDDGRILEVNGAFERLSGHARAEAVGKPIEELALWADPDLRRQVLQILRERGRLHGRQGTLRRADGRLAEVIGSFEVLDDPQEPLVLTVLRSEIRDARNVEAARLSSWLADTRLGLRIEVLASTLLENAAYRATDASTSPSHDLQVQDRRGRLWTLRPPSFAFGDKADGNGSPS
jgi:PAS domain S-box-containing protein